MDEPLYPEIPEDLSALSEDELASLRDELAASIKEVTEAPSEFVTTTAEDLVAATRAAVESLAAVRAELAARETPEEEEEGDAGEAGDGDDGEAAAEAEAVSEEAAAELAELGELAAQPEDDEETEGETDGVPGGKVMPNVKGKVAAKKAKSEIVAAGFRNALPALPKPQGDRAPRESRPAVPTVSLVAGAGATDMPLGYEFGSMTEVANAMIKRRYGGNVRDGVVEKEVIARADWRDAYPADRRLTMETLTDGALVAAATDPKDVRARFNQRKQAQIENPRDMSLVASGGLCNPVTPYYQLQIISTPMRPVQAALPAFNADRGGIRYMPPAGLSAVTTAVGIITEAEDAAGGSSATKTCQTVTCNDLTEVDVDIIYHCLTFGNLQARAFPEQVTQFSETTLAAWSRTAEANLLTGIGTSSTAITAGSLGLGASASLFSQILAAANGLRSRNRMDPSAILRLMMPFWAIDLIISDVIRTQFQRFDTDEAKIVAMFREWDIEPSFYLDGATAAGQVFGTQSAGALLPFPPTVVSYLFPEGSFLYLDGGVLELGIVRDSVLNTTNVFQLFGEGFEAPAFVGIESLALTSSVCDNGKVSAPYATDACPYSYTASS